jgi:hypothetical protein
MIPFTACFCQGKKGTGTMNIETLQQYEQPPSLEMLAIDDMMLLLARCPYRIIRHSLVHYRYQRQEGHGGSWQSWRGTRLLAQQSPDEFPLWLEACYALIDWYPRCEWSYLLYARALWGKQAYEQARHILKTTFQRFGLTQWGLTIYLETLYVLGHFEQAYQIFHQFLMRPIIPPRAYLAFGLVMARWQQTSMEDLPPPTWQEMERGYQHVLSSLALSDIDLTTWYLPLLYALYHAPDLDKA